MWYMLGMLFGICSLIVSVVAGQKTMRYMETLSFWSYFATVVLMYFMFLIVLLECGG